VGLTLISDWIRNKGVIEWAILGGLLGILGASVAIIFIKQRADPTIFKKQNRYTNYIDELEKDNKTLKGKLNASKRSVSVQGDFDLSDASGLQGLIHELVPKIAPLLPKSLQPLLNNPKTFDMVYKMIEDNPEAAKGILSKFITPGKGQKTEAEQVEAV